MSIPHIIWSYIQIPLIQLFIFFLIQTLTKAHFFVKKKFFQTDKKELINQFSIQFHYFCNKQGCRITGYPGYHTDDYGKKDNEDYGKKDNEDYGEGWEDGYDY